VELVERRQRDERERDIARVQMGEVSIWSTKKLQPGQPASGQPSTPGANMK
jgi:hypothetical protein